MNFDKNAYTVESLTVGVHTIRYRQFADLLYADLPANAAYQRMHIYAPEGFYEGESINGYSLRLLRFLCRIKSAAICRVSRPRREKRRKLRDPEYGFLCAGAWLCRSCAGDPRQGAAG